MELRALGSQQEGTRRDRSHVRRNRGAGPLAMLLAISAVALGCGSDGDATSAARPEAAKGSPAQLAERLGRLLATTTKKKKHCGQLDRLTRRAFYDFRCPQLRDVRRSMARFEVIGSATYGTGAVVDYRTGALEDGAVLTMRVAPDGAWTLSRFGLLYEPAVETSDEDSRDGFDSAVQGYLEAVRERDCDLYARHSFSEAEEDDICKTDFAQTEHLAKTLEANPAAAPEYLGGNESFGFYGLTLPEPKSRYLTINVVKAAEGSLRPFLVLDVTPGPAAGAG